MGEESRLAHLETPQPAADADGGAREPGPNHSDIEALKDGAAISIAPAIRSTAPSTPATPDAAPLPTMRLLPRVPFRFCIHTDADRHWMQLEGGTTDLVPAALRVIDPSENVVESRLCIPLAPSDKGHARVVADEAPGVAWVVVAIPDAAVSAIEEGRSSGYGFQAKVDEDWLSLDLVDTGCRLGRTQAKHAAS